MSLLADLFAGDALDPEYAAAAGRRAPGTRRGVGRAGVSAMLALAGLLAAVAGVQMRRHEPAAVKERHRLVAEIRDRTAASDALERRLGARGEDTQPAPAPPPAPRAPRPPAPPDPPRAPHPAPGTA